MKQVEAAALLSASLAGRDLDTATPAFNVDVASSWAAVAHGTVTGALLQHSLPKSLLADWSQAASDPTSRKSLLLPEQQATTLQEPPCKPIAGLPGTCIAASRGQAEVLGHNQRRSPQKGYWQLAQQEVATHGGGQQPWIVELHKHRAATTGLSATGLSTTGQAPDTTAGQTVAGLFAKGLAPGNTAGMSATQQVPGSMAEQLAAGEVPGSSPERLPRGAKQHHIAAAQTQSVAALQRAADTVPSWAETTLPDHSGSLHHHGFLASAVMLETLGRQKQMQALSLHASCGSPPEGKAAMDPQKNETHHQGSGPGGVRPESGHRGSTPGPGQGEFSPESPTSHKWVHHSRL